MQQEPKISATALYPAMRTGVEEVKPQRPPGMAPYEYALRQLYPSMYGKEWADAYHERWKDDWD